GFRGPSCTLLGFVAEPSLGRQTVLTGRARTGRRTLATLSGGSSGRHPPSRIVIAGVEESGEAATLTRVLTEERYDVRRVGPGARRASSGAGRQAGRGSPGHRGERPGDLPAVEAGSRNVGDRRVSAHGPRG